MAAKENTDSPISIKNKYSTTIFPIVLGIVDYLSIIIAEWISLCIRNSVVTGSSFHFSWLSFHVIVPVVYIGFMQVYSLYTKRIQFWQVISEIFKVSVYAIAALIFIIYVVHTAAVTSRLFMGLFGISAFILLVIGRYLVKKALGHIQALQVPVLMMGAGKMATLMIDYLKKDAGLGYDFIGCLEDNTPQQNILDNMPWLGGFKDAERVIQQTGVQHVMVIAPGLTNDEIQSIVYRLQPLVKKISFIPDMSGMPLATIEMKSLIDGHVVAFSFKNNLAQRYNRMIKRVFDIVSTVIGIVCLSPIMRRTPARPRPLSQVKKFNQLSLSSFMPSAAPRISRNSSLLTPIATKTETF